VALEPEPVAVAETNPVEEANAEPGDGVADTDEIQTEVCPAAEQVLANAAKASWGLSPQMDSMLFWTSAESLPHIRSRLEGSGWLPTAASRHHGVSAATMRRTVKIERKSVGFEMNMFAEIDK